MKNTVQILSRLHWFVAGPVALAMACAATGCHPTSVTRERFRQIELEMLASNGPKPETNSYVILQKQKTVGRFPCCLAVMRVTAAAEDLPDASDRPRTEPLEIDLLPQPKAVPWTELFDNFPSITTVNVMGRPSVVFENVSIAELIVAGKKQDASLLLVYGEDDAGGGLVRMVGAIYDTASGALVATLEAQVDPIPGLPIPSDRLKQDTRDEDARWLTAKRFQDLALRCIVDLARMDTPSTTTQPNPWEGRGTQPMLSPWTGPRYVW